MAVSSRQNQNMMNLIRKVHGLVERPDLTKHRQSQDRIGAILGTEKGIAYEETEVDGMSCEWVKVCLLYTSNDWRIRPCDWKRSDLCAN